MCSHDSGPWKLIPLSLLLNVGEKPLFQCNYDRKNWCINEQLQKFYRNVLIHWQELNCTTLKEKEDILNQTIWNNHFIRTNNSSVYYWIWNQVSILCKLACPVNDIGKRFLCKNLKLSVIFCTTLACSRLYLISGKKSLKREEHQHVLASTEHMIAKLTCKTVYNTLIRRQQFPPTAEKRINEMHFWCTKVTKHLLFAILYSSRRGTTHFFSTK